MSEVVVAKYAGDGARKGLDQQAYSVLLKAGMQALSGEKQPKAAVLKYLPSGVIGMKTNCLAHKSNSTPTALAEALSGLLAEAGYNRNDIIVWERTNRELKNAGFALNAASFGGRCLGTDTTGIGYSSRFYSSGEVNSLVSRILTDVVDYNINLPVLKDHSIAGLSAGMKNMYGAINNPNKYHGNNCDPFCAHVNNLTPIRKKNRLTIIDAVKVQYHGGPGYVSEYVSYYNGILLSDDPVAVDRVGLEILENLRKANGLPPLEKVGRQVNYLRSAEHIGLGAADMGQINIVVLSIDQDGRQTGGELF